MRFNRKLCNGWGRWTEVVHGQLCSGTCTRCGGSGRADLSQVRRFWLVSYYPARLARSTWDARRRHARVRLFLDAGEAADFASTVWHSRHWRLLSEVEVCRTGLSFEPVLPF
jgi:hypothetical protein